MRYSTLLIQSLKYLHTTVDYQTEICCTSDGSLYYCNFCEEEFNSHKAAQVHFKRNYRDGKDLKWTEPLNNISHPKSSEGKFICNASKCREVLKNKESLKAHFILKHMRNYIDVMHRCTFPGCTSVFDTQDMLTTHTAYWHQQIDSEF